MASNSGSCGSSIWKCITTLIHIILLPVYITCFFVFLLLWILFTITGIGPLLQYCYTVADRKKLDPSNVISNAPNPTQMRMVTVPNGIHHCSPDKPYRIFAIYAEPSNGPSKYPPVCIPNGLGATATLISQMQEKLVEAGFTVLSFDRLGVGLSDENKSGKSPTAMDLVQEMDFVMNSFQPNETKWILLGPSMGSIVAQCYMSIFPDKVVGFLNMDGLPYPFFKHNSSFMWAAFIYRMYSSIIWTGILRPFIGIGLKSNSKMFECKNFPLSIAIAQMNQARFYANVGLEMATMMDCCEMAELAWGQQSILRIPKQHYKTLVCARPTVSIDFDDRTGERKETSLRSESEVGSEWASDEDVQQAVEFLRSPNSATSTVTMNPAVKDVAIGSVVSNSSSTNSSTTSADPLLKYDALESMSKVGGYGARSSLGELWSRLAVRVMSGRNHDFGNAMANSFYNQEMRDMAAAEHAKHALLALDGGRTNYPRLTHTVVFSKTDDIVRNIQEIAFALEKSGQQQDQKMPL